TWSPRPAAPEGAATSAYFQIGDVAYVLVAETEGEKLVRAAADLARSLR
ncbi:Fis family transcriptional regulator, partial [Amaricoccus sp. HAR-UPW-R2A-40]